VKPSELQTIFDDTLTVFWGEWLDLRARVVQIAATGLVSPLIYIIAFGLGLGSAVDMAMKPTAGNNYLEFILPGMVALSSMAISFGGTTFSICGDRLFSKTFEELLLLPVHPLALYLGKMFAGIVYLLPLTYTSLGLRAAAYSPLSEFPWYVIPILLISAIILAFMGAKQFSHQQD
jgi:ABC-type multidrug transport system permease subunit